MTSPPAARDAPRFVWTRVACSGPGTLRAGHGDDDARWRDVALAHWERAAGPCLQLRRHEWGGETYVARVPADGPAYLFKRYRLAGIRWLRFLYRCWRGTQARRQHERLRLAGFTVPRLICILEHRRFGITVGALTIQEYVVGAQPLSEFVRRPLPPARRREFSRGLGRALARLHGQGFYHGELLSPNVLWLEDRAEFCWVDNDRGRHFARIPWRLVLHDLEQLNRFGDQVSRADLWRTWHTYAKELRLPRRIRKRLLRALLRRERRAAARGRTGVMKPPTDGVG